MRWIKGAGRTLWRQSFAFPFATNLSLVSLPIGLLAVLIGNDISAGFTAVWHRPEPIYVWGVMLLLGGLNVAAGLLRRKPAQERAGLFVVSVAYAFYGICVMLGLKFGGMVTGPTFVVLALSSLQRAHNLRPLAALGDLHEHTGRIPACGDDPRNEGHRERSD